MPLYLLEPTDCEDTRNHGYDIERAFVVRAKSEEEARTFVVDAIEEMALKGGYLQYNIQRGKIWADHLKTTCKEINTRGKNEIILCDFIEA